jgi:hypothetical protein
MDSTIEALLSKKFKDADMDLAAGRHYIDETVVIHISGSVERHEDQWVAPTVSIPLIPTIAFFWDRLGVEKNEAMKVLRDAINQAMQAKVEESSAIKSKMDDVAASIAAVKQDLLSVLPKMRRSGRTDLSDLTVSVSSLTPVSEPLYSVA